MAKNKKIMR